jgi:hypothetical protein
MAHGVEEWMSDGKAVVWHWARCRIKLDFSSNVLYCIQGINLFSLKQAWMSDYEGVLSSRRAAA